MINVWADYYKDKDEVIVFVNGYAIVERDIGVAYKLAQAAGLEEFTIRTYGEGAPVSTRVRTGKIEMKWPRDIEGEFEDAQALLLRLIEIHCRATGPVSFASVRAFVNEQHPNASDIPDAEVRSAIVELVRKRRIELYDTGDAWWTAV